MSSIKLQILHALHRRVFPQGTQQRFDDVLLDILEHEVGKSPGDAAAILLRDCSRYWNDVRKNIDHDLNHDRSPAIHVSDVQRKTFLPYPDYVSQSGNTSKGDLLRAKPLILSEIDLLTDREFEAFACGICTLLGCTEYHLTPPGDEGGIDFFASLKVTTDNHVFGSNQRCLRIVGQTKKYSDKETITSFNSFITTLGNVRTLHRSVSHHVPAWFKRTSGPIIGWYIASSGYQQGVITTAQEQGVILSDALDLAEVAALKLHLVAGATPQDRANEVKTFTAGFL